MFTLFMLADHVSSKMYYCQNLKGKRKGMMEKWWEVLSSSPEASHVISFLDSQAQSEMIKQSRTETKKLQLLGITRQRKNRSLNATALCRLNNGKLLRAIVLL